MGAKKVKKLCELCVFARTFFLFLAKAQRAPRKTMHENDLAREIVDAAYKVHTSLGPGLLESVYEAAMAYDLQKRGLMVNRQVPLPVIFGEVRLEEGFRADLVVGGKVMVELKSVDKIADVHKKQLLTYLKLSGMKLGLLINFNEALIKDGITRIVNKL
jgi:GxxExxY protein